MIGSETQTPRFWKKVQQCGSCWIWVGAGHKYGTTKIAGHRAPLYVHRLSYEYFFSTKLEAGQEIDHVCRNPRCVNPVHLNLVSRSENMKRAYMSKRGIDFMQIIEGTRAKSVLL